MDGLSGFDRDAALRETAALRDGNQIVRQQEQDERDAVEARARYRSEGLSRMVPDALVADHLGRDESIVDVRQAALVHRHRVGEHDDAVAGALYLTTRRLVLIGQHPLELDLQMIDEVALVGGRLLVTLRDATGVSIEAPRPRLLRVQIAAALEATRG